MAVLNGLPGIGVVVRVNGSLANEYPAPDPNPPRFAFRKCTSAYILSSDDVEFSVGLAVDELYDFSLDEDYQLRFRVTIDGDRLEAECMISKDQVAAGHGRAR
ncbi:conidiation protein 6 [Apiospora arundinis]